MNKIFFWTENVVKYDRQKAFKFNIDAIIRYCQHQKKFNLGIRVISLIPYISYIV